MILKSIFKKIQPIFLVLLSIVVTLVMIELLLQLTHYQKKFTYITTGIPYQFRVFPHDPVRVYTPRYEPNSPLSSDGKGAEKFQLRPDFIPNDQITDTTFTILEIGDSFTYGHNVEGTESYPAFLEKMLTEQGYNVNVINAGVPGYGNDQEYVYVKQILQHIKPNVIVWNINENDVQDDNEYCLFREDKDGVYRQVPGSANTVYMKSVITKYTPLFLHQSKVLNIALSAFPPKENVLCTQKGGHETDKKMVAKLKYFLDTLKTDLPPETSLIVTLMPVQNYFVSTTENYNEPLQRVQWLRQELKEFQVFDFGHVIASQYAPQVLADREHIPKDYRVYDFQQDDDLQNSISAEVATATHSGQVLGARDLSRVLFLDEKKEPESLYGNRHPSIEGNAVMARFLAEEIVSRFKLPTQTTLSTPQ